MAMIQKSFNIALSKGEIGENIVKEYLESKGWIVYCPFTKNKAHYFDQLATKDKQQVIALDVKTKARLNNWPAQGIDIKHYNEYKNFIEKVNVPFYIVFVDDKNGDVYAQELKELKNGFNPTPYIIAWDIKQMRFLFNIGDEKIKLLSKYDQRNYEFKPNNLLED